MTKNSKDLTCCVPKYYTMKRLNVFSCMFAIALLLVSTASVGTSYADILAPNHQKKIGITSEDIVCDSGLFKVIRAKTNSIACVNPHSVSKLVSNGWAKKVDEKLLADALNKKSIELGTIQILEKTPVRTNVGKLASGTPISGYDIVFEVCASTSIYAPDILITSDSESKRFELIETVLENSCVIGVSKIKAADVKSISISMLNKGDISEKILTLQNELESLKTQLQNTKQSIKNPEATDAQKYGMKIADIRKQVNDKREELYRLLFTLHLPPTAKQKIEKYTFSGDVIEGESAKVLSVLNATDTTGQYDVIFEACAGKDTVRLPVITITSDKQTSEIKIGEKISANSCQMSYAKIDADDKTSIKVMPAGNASASNQASNYEVLIASLQDEMVKEKQELKSLVHDPKRASNFAELLDMKVTKIIELRNQIANAKAEFSKILYLTYN